MTFIDRAKIRAIAGHGGAGSMSFRREKFVPKGGPDGGDGGRGASIYLKADSQLRTLLDYRYKTHWKGESGTPGHGTNKTGKSGEDEWLRVPPGTEVRDFDTGELLGELTESGQELCVAKGGRGGRGNTAFKSPTHQSPREWEPGGKGEQRHIELVLKLIADVGLLGEPNAGKSTLLSVMSAARPKIADYPFTTLEPNLGVVGLSDSRSFVIADIPGIIEGAHAGRGLGDKFLQHVERNRVLAYLVPIDAEDPQANYDMLRLEAREYDQSLADKPHIVVLTKVDLLPPDEDIPEIDAPDADAVLVISSVTRQALQELGEHLWKVLSRVEDVSSDSEPLP